jgi:hypothetical protein
MAVEAVRLCLHYHRADLECLFAYAQAHNVERRGRYHVQNVSVLNIWTHTWSNPGCKAESSLMCSLAFDRNTAALASVVLQPGYDWDVLCDELARLETAALGEVVWGELRAAPAL